LLAFDEPHHAIGAGANPAVEVALLEARGDVLLDDALDDRVGQRALDAAPGDDPDAPVLLRHQEQHAVVDPLAAELPGIEDAHAVFDRRLGLGGRHQQHGDLAALARLELGERLLERRVLLVVQRAGEVGDARLERRHRNLRQGDGREEQRLKEQRACPEVRWGCARAAGSGAPEDG
jgi:hypothetical protein